MTAPRTPESILSAYFGPFAVSTWQLLPSIEAATRNQPYSFMDMDAYNALVRERPERAQAIYWREMIMRVHLSCCASVLRHTEWLNALFMTIDGNCLFGTYAACRGFLESAADACYSLSPVPKTLATSLASIRARLKERPTDTVYISKELEDRLIHFTHGRKLQRKEVADPVHAAKQIREYLDGLQQLGVADVHALYGELCSITHPSAESVLIWFEGTKEAQEVIWRRTETDQRECIEKFLNDWKETNEGVFNAAFVPAFMSLRHLHKLDFLPKIPELKSFPLENFPAWKTIERQITK
ncbi:hypothetical protein [Bradyrhizobium erythrophlei]|nr:hypothetical protein [Bradyrhizobium erythrophlei]